MNDAWIKIKAKFLMIIMNSYLQEDSEKTGKVTSAGMYFLHFQVYRMDSTMNAVCLLIIRLLCECFFFTFPKISVP